MNLVALNYDYPAHEMKSFVISVMTYYKVLEKIYLL